MRSRDVTIPLGLWICAAVCAHFLFGTGGLVVGTMHDDSTELWKLAHDASQLAAQGEVSFDVSLAENNDTVLPREEVPPPKLPQPVAPMPPEVKPVPTVDLPPPPPPLSPPQTKAIALVPKLKESEKQVVLPPEPLKDRRIAVVQHVRPNQDDNPAAKFIGNEANHVEKETVATQTSHDKDDESPTPGGNHPGADSRPGDSNRTRIADAEDRPGQKNRAPGERVPELEIVREPKIPAASSPPAAGVRAVDRSPGSHERRPTPESAEPSPEAPPAPSPDVQSAAGGTWSFNPTRPVASATAPTDSGTGPATPSLPGGKLWSLPGLGKNAAPGSINTNLNPAQVVAVVGSDTLQRLRESDGERRRSEHRGSWIASNFERWRSAIENYVSSVKPGNQTALNTARSPFATYLTMMHVRIHPIFADSFLGSLDQLPADHPLNDQKLMTLLEIVLGRDGRLVRMGVVKTSGLTTFDIAALDAVDRAQPFGPAPGQIVSGDGRVYLHWEFHRDEVYACSTAGAQPFLLPAASPEEPRPGPGTPTGPSVPGLEHGVPPASPNDSRRGSLPNEIFLGAGTRAQALRGSRVLVADGSSFRARP